LSSVATLRRALGGGHVLVDCSDLTAVDADAVGALGEIHAALREVGCELVVYRAHGGLLREAQLRGFSFV
jgi:anti-anti-sigma regulatory factor